jgi:hypothetical protein
MGTGFSGIQVSPKHAIKHFRSDALVIVVFRLTVFRPFPTEVILAKVKSSDENGIQCACPPTTQRRGRHSSHLFQYQSAFSKTCGSLSPFSLNHAHCTLPSFCLDESTLMPLTLTARTVIQTNAHISGSQVQKQLQPTNYSILP